MGTLEATRTQVALLTLFLGKAEARDKICRTIQYASKFVSNGEPGIAADVDKTTSLARKVFRLAKYLNEVHALMTPAAKSTPLPIVLLMRIKSALMASYFGLDQVVWVGRVGIYKNKEKTDLASKVSLYCFMTGSATSTIIEICELLRLKSNQKKLDKEIRNLKMCGSPEEEQLRQRRLLQAEKARERALNLVKVAVDIVVGVGLLQLAPKTITHRVTGGLGTISALIACYQLFPPASQLKSKEA